MQGSTNILGKKCNSRVKMDIIGSSGSPEKQSAISQQGDVFSSISHLDLGRAGSAVPPSVTATPDTASAASLTWTQGVGEKQEE